MAIFLLPRTYRSQADGSSLFASPKERKGKTGGEKSHKRRRRFVVFAGYRARAGIVIIIVVLDARPLDAAALGAGPGDIQCVGAQASSGTVFVSVLQGVSIAARWSAILDDFNPKNVFFNAEKRTMYRRRIQVRDFYTANEHAFIKRFGGKVSIDAPQVNAAVHVLAVDRQADVIVLLHGFVNPDSDLMFQFLFSALIVIRGVIVGGIIIRGIIIRSIVVVGIVVGIIVLRESRQRQRNEKQENKQQFFHFKPSDAKNSKRRKIISNNRFLRTRRVPSKEPKNSL
jgi:hypothetical protein